MSEILTKLQSEEALEAIEAVIKCSNAGIRFSVVNNMVEHEFTKLLKN